MFKNPFVFWIAFASFWGAGLFIPIMKFHKPGSEPWLVPLWAAYYLILNFPTSDMLLAIAFGVAFLHCTGAIFLAAFATAIYREARAFLVKKSAAATTVAGCD